MRVIKIVSVMLVLALIGSVMAGTTGKIAGVVTDASTGDPLPGVNVLVNGTTLGAATDLEGYYVILNVPPGEYEVTASMVGYTEITKTQVRVRIDQTTTLNYNLGEQALEAGETITVVAERPVVEKDVAASRANISTEEIESIPVAEVANVVGLQAGIEGLSIRGGGSSEVAFVVNGITLRDERNNSPYTGISLTSVEELQVQAGGFSAEFGNIRSGIVNVVTKEGKRDKYTFSFLGRYSPLGDKHFGPSPNAPGSYWVRPYVDDEVAWTGTDNGAWDKYTRAQYPYFKGWNKISEELLQNDDPNDDLSPAAAQRLYLFQHRKQLDIAGPDFTADMSFGGPVPYVSDQLGNLRFFASYRNSQSMYLVPLHRDAYRDYTWQLKLTSDLGQGKKLMISGLLGAETGVDRWNNGTPGMFTSSWQIASALSNGPKYIEGRMFSTDYWGPARTDYTNLGVKYTHALDEKTFFEVSFSTFTSDYEKHPGARRDTADVYKFGNNYYVDEAPFGFQSLSTSAINGMRTGAGMSNARDSSEVQSYSLKFDITKQVDRRNNVQLGGEFVLTHSNITYGRYDQFLPTGNYTTKWDKWPRRGALYIQDKLEFQGMIAQLGLRMDYSHAGGEWYDYSQYPQAFSGTYVEGIDTLLNKEPTEHIFTFSPRLAIAFPVTETSKLYFNYGHFRQLPQPDDLYMLRQSGFTDQILRVGNPNAELQKTVAYELGYEQSVLDQFLIRAAGYYKDISLQPRLVTYENNDGSISYSRAEPNNYEDIRGFEITLNKNRGQWVRGFLNYTYMVSTYGYFGYGIFYENPALQRQYEQTTTYYYQAKPKPRPYARANIDFFSPDNFGPKIADTHPLAEWRLNFLANWKTGRYDTW
ncbi:MAG: TonB-dependent receptor plug domain-containing protein, partial [Caldithrix sp.]|nr:TonB-dependent receptor plug domain-containing protein [Caldithrix sp.]